MIGIEFLIQTQFFTAIIFCLLLFWGDRTTFSDKDGDGRSIFCSIKWPGKIPFEHQNNLFL